MAICLEAGDITDGEANITAAIQVGDAVREVPKPCPHGRGYLISETTAHDRQWRALEGMAGFGPAKVRKTVKNSTLAKRIRPFWRLPMAARRYRYSWDHINALSSDYMARWGAFVPGCETVVGYDDDDERLLIHYTMDSERDVFTARYTACRIGAGRREVQVQQIVQIERRPCRFGGHRIYFRCPSCWGAKLKLAVLPEGLRCGRCGSITWGSRREHAPQREIRRANKLAAKLQVYEWNEAPMERPSHMRMAKFQFLKAEKDMLADRINDRLNRQFLQSARVRRLLARR